MSTYPTLSIRNDMELRQRLLPLRIIQQETDFSCGGACVCMLLEYYGLLGERKQDDISFRLGTRFSHPRPGTHPDRILEFLRGEGLAVIAGEGGTLELIYDAIDEGTPVLVLDSTWGGHWRLAIGYELCGHESDWMKDKLLLADPEYRMDIPTIDRHSGITTQNSRQFYKQWYENRAFEKSFERYYILATHGKRSN